MTRLCSNPSPLPTLSSGKSALLFAVLSACALAAFAQEPLPSPASLPPTAADTFPFGHMSAEAVPYAEPDVRHLRLGDPLIGTSWLNRPFYAGWMFGGLWGDELIEGRIEQSEDIFGGYRLGWDFDPFWGVEGRYASAHLDFVDQADISIDRTAEHQYWDVDLLYYPWGDSRWRPYASVGLGLVSIDLLDGFDEELGETLITVPLGAGVKYFWKHWMTLRVSVTDNLALANEPFDTMHNVSITGDVEIRFGGTRMSYFPYHGSIHLW